MALTTSANIGSAMLATGNPQNALIMTKIRQKSGSITFLGFFRMMSLSTLLSQLLNLLFLFIVYESDLNTNDTSVSQASKPAPAPAPSEDTDASAPKETELLIMKDKNNIIQTSPAVVECCGGASEGAGAGAGADNTIGCFGDPQRFIFGVVYSVGVVGMVAFDFTGRDMDGVAFLTAMIMLVVHAVLSTPTDLDATETMVKHVDWSLLLLFIGQFMMINILVETGTPEKIFNGLLDVFNCTGTHMVETDRCLVWFSLVVMFLSNLISNVPVIIMLAPLIPDATADRVWPIVAFVTTVAGNGCMLGSAVNLIVERAASKAGCNEMEWWGHFKYGAPTTMVITLGGVLFLKHLVLR
jgi:Na+/H+ antiporter NhaD/arsenite permease-like protein